MDSIYNIERTMTSVMQQGTERVNEFYHGLQGKLHPAMLRLTKLSDQLTKLKTQYSYHQSKSLGQQIETLTKNIEGINGFLKKASTLQIQEIFEADIKRAELTLNTIMSA